MPNAAAEVDWQAGVVAVVVATKLIAQYDISEMLRAAEKAQTLAPIFDPTLYRKKAGALREDMEVLRAALPLWQLAQRLVSAGAEKP